MAAGLAVVAGLAGCSRAKVESAPEPPPVPVRIAPVVMKSLPIQVQAIGTGEAYSNVQVKPQVTGVLTAVLFKEGDFVRKGQLLFTIDPQPFQATLNQAAGTLAKDEAQAKNAEVTAERYQKLYAAGIVPRQQYDLYQSQADSAGALVKADKAAVESARLQLAYCKIYSPMDGRTGSLLVNVGNVVKANDVPVLMTINQVNPIYVNFSVPQNLLPQIRQAMAGGRPSVTAYLANDEQHAEAGRLTFIDNSVDQATGTIRLKGTFPNTNHRLWPGEFVTVTLKLGEESNAIVVPVPALETSQQGSYVWVVGSDETVQMRMVTVQRQTQDEAVIAKGLKPGERVVTDGQLQLTPGARIQIRTSL
jgi:multidrug efflux system membrane fusion protein